jgi:hypothetical protein
VNFPKWNNNLRYPCRRYEIQANPKEKARLPESPRQHPMAPSSHRKPMETAMQNETTAAKRHPDGSLDIQHYVRISHAERRETRNAAMRAVGRSIKRAALAIVVFFTFWNVPPMGGAGPKETPYR